MCCLVCVYVLFVCVAIILFKKVQMCCLVCVYVLFLCVAM